MEFYIQIQMRESFLESQFGHLLDAYRQRCQKLEEIQSEYSVKSKKISDNTHELAKISQELGSVKSQLEAKGSSLSDTSPIVKIKQAIKALRQELSQMEVRISSISCKRRAKEIHNDAFTDW